MTEPAYTISSPMSIKAMTTELFLTSEGNEISLLEV